MSDLSLRELARVIDGKLYLADLPPLDGDQQFVYDIHFELSNLSPGGLYWDLSCSRESSFGKAELAFANGAAGVLTEHQPSHPWAGGYTLQVDNCQLALRQLAYFLRQRAKQHVLLLGPGVAESRCLTALQSLLELSPQAEPSPSELSFGATTDLGTGIHSRLLALNSLHDPALHATLLLTAPDFIILGRSDADWLRQQSSTALHRILECLAPAGNILYCDLSPAPPSAWRSDTTAPSWAEMFAAAGIHYHRIGSDHHADFQVRPATPAAVSYVMKIGKRWLHLPKGSYEETVAEATALGTSALLGLNRAA